MQDIRKYFRSISTSLSKPSFSAPKAGVVPTAIKRKRASPVQAWHGTAASALMSNFSETKLITDCITSLDCHSKGSSNLHCCCFQENLVHKNFFKIQSIVYPDLLSYFVPNKSMHHTQIVYTYKHVILHLYLYPVLPCQNHAQGG